MLVRNFVMNDRDWCVFDDTTNPVACLSGMGMEVKP